MQYVLYSIRFYFHHQTHPQLVIVLALAQHFHSSEAVFPLFSSSILGTYQLGEFIFPCHIFLPFHTVHGVLKTRMLKSFAIPFSSDSSSDSLEEELCQTCWMQSHFSHVQLSATLWTVAHQSSPSMGFSRREY